MLNRLRNTIMQFMAGRYGSDAFSRFLTVVYLVIAVISMVLPWFAVRSVLYLLGNILFFYLMFRMLSRNIPARQRENQRFIGWWGGVRVWLRHQKDRIRDFGRCSYRQCPCCKAWLRLPIKRGRRTVTCARCHTQFKTFFL